MKILVEVEQSIVLIAAMGLLVAVNLWSALTVPMGSLVVAWLLGVSVGRTVSLAVKVPVLRARHLQERNIE